MGEYPKSFDELIKTADKPVLVDFWAEWCGPCRMVSPIIEQIAKDYSGRILTIKINSDKKPEIAAKYQITGIPTIMLFKNGLPVMRLVGAQPANEIKRQIDLHIS